MNPGLSRGMYEVPKDNLSSRPYDGPHDKSHTTEEPDDAKGSRPVLKPSQRGRPRWLRQRPEGEGRETVQRYPANAQADHGERSVELAKWTFPIISLSREPYEAKVSRTGLTGGMGRRTVRQRALCLPSDKYSRLIHRVSSEQKGLDERALLASQRPSPPWGRPQSQPSGHTDPPSADSNPSLPHLPSLRHPCAGCGHGGTRNSSTSRRVHTRSVSPAAIAGVHGCHCLAEPFPLVGRGCGNGWRTLVWGKQKL